MQATSVDIDQFTNCKLVYSELVELKAIQRRGRHDEANSESSASAM